MIDYDILETHCSLSHLYNELKRLQHTVKRPGCSRHLVLLQLFFRAAVTNIEFLTNWNNSKKHASPSLTWSKVELVLHLQWRKEDGAIITWTAPHGAHMASTGASPHLLTSNIIWPVHCSEVPADQQEHCAAKPGSQHSKGFPLFFSETSFHEWCYAGTEENGLLCPRKNTEILHRQPCKNLSTEVCC